MNISWAERGKKRRIERGEGDCTHGPELHVWPSPCAVPVNGDPSEESERGRWSRRRGKRRVVHRQEISPGKLIPKHKSHRPPLLFPPKSWSGFISSSLSTMHTELWDHLWRQKKKKAPQILSQGKPSVSLTNFLWCTTASLWTLPHKPSVCSWFEWILQHCMVTIE